MAQTEEEFTKSIGISTEVEPPPETKKPDSSEKKMSEESYIQKQRRKFEEATDGYRKETNEIFRELVQQLILVGTVFLSVSVFVFDIQDVAQKIANIERNFLIIAWILLAISLICGIAQYIVDYYYFRQWTTAKAGILESLYDGKINEKNIVDEVKKRQKIRNESSTVAVRLQIMTLALGIVLLVFVMCTSLFPI